MQHGIEYPPLGQRQQSGPGPHELELARIWAQLLAASRTDIKARQFVDYFRADANRLFGASEPFASR